MVVLVGTALTAACAAAVDVEQERSALLAEDMAWSQTVGDMETFMSYFAPDATAYPQGAPKVMGTEALRAMLTDMMSAPGFSLQWTPSKAEVSAAGDMGYTVGTYTTTGNDAAGNPMTEQGKYITIWKKQADGQWKAVEDIFNADAPPPAPAPAPGDDPAKP
jgi:ketosteroid isomerase-like protein